MSPSLTFPDASRPSRRSHEVLAGALGHDDDRVAASVEPLLEQGQESLEGERDLRNQAEVDVAVDERRRRRR